MQEVHERNREPALVTGLEYKLTNTNDTNKMWHSNSQLLTAWFNNLVALCPHLSQLLLHKRNVLDSSLILLWSSLPSKL